MKNDEMEPLPPPLKSILLVNVYALTIKNNPTPNCPKNNNRSITKGNCTLKIEFKVSKCTKKVPSTAHPLRLSIY